MANDLVYVVVDQGTPGEYTSAHQINKDECIRFSSPEGGCAVWFSVGVDHTHPKNIPTHISDGQLIYALAGNDEFDFYFANEESLLYFVGPPVPPTKASLAAAQGHTVIVGGVGFGR
jgi:hypothetical protein